MGNQSSQSETKSHSKESEITSEQKSTIIEQIIQLLSPLCTDDQFPLCIFHQRTDKTSHYRIIEILSSIRQSDEFPNILIKLYWNDRASISRDDVTKLFRDCCMFDLKQAMANNINQFQTNMLDNECFLALTNSIGKITNLEITPEEFSNWMRVQFPTLFYGFEMWLRKNSVLNKTSSTNQEISASNNSIITMNNVLNPTWIWLLTYHLPNLYLSADNTCTNLVEKMSSILHGRMWDHLYDSHRDGSSLNRFQHHIFGYKAPIIILFEISDGYLFCLCCDEEFRESPKHFGGIQSCLLQLKPVFKVVLEGPNIIFMNTKLRGVSALGLFIGRDHTHTFLNIDGDFFNVKHINGEGRLAAIDVWGAGGTKSADEQKDIRQWENKQVEKSRKVKRSYEEEEAILNMAGIETRRAQDQF
ncbi:unnamed protein product [Adineta steineri]|uniref:TLDc domain-containing protein n=1 Tax=Adineta steineri TaxID=433720 RepID=A0A818X816_9BILA|nr:unnamed protein product [Adineta steineri]